MGSGGGVRDRTFSVMAFVSISLFNLISWRLLAIKEANVTMQDVHISPFRNHISNVRKKSNSTGKWI